MFLARTTWPNAQAYFARNDLVFIGVGSLECHGRHNPLGTDTMAPDYLMELVDKLDPSIMIAPTLPYGATDDLMGFPGTISLGTAGLSDLMQTICDQLYDYGARRFVFVNGHGGNVKALSEVAITLNQMGCLACLVNWWRTAPQLNPAWGGGHGDGMETSANLAIDPESVLMDAVAPEGLRDDIGGDFHSTGWYSVDFDGISVDFPRPLVRFASNGWVAEGHDVPPQNASAELGHAMLNGTAEYLVKLAKGLRETPLPEPMYAPDELQNADAYIAELTNAPQEA